VKPLKHTGDSANIAFYGEPIPEADGRVWVEVCDVWRARGGKRTFRFTIYVQGIGQIERFLYRPRISAPGRLSEEMVTSLVRRKAGPALKRAEDWLRVTSR
jgi:hypothetical protein